VGKSDPRLKTSSLKRTDKAPRKVIKEKRGNCQIKGETQEFSNCFLPKAGAAASEWERYWARVRRGGGTLRAGRRMASELSVEAQGFWVYANRYADKKKATAPLKHFQS